MYFSKIDLDLGKSIILKHDIKLTEYQPLKERYKAHAISFPMKRWTTSLENGGDWCYQKRFSATASAMVLAEEEGWWT